MFSGGRFGDNVFASGASGPSGAATIAGSATIVCEVGGAFSGQDTTPSVAATLARVQRSPVQFGTAATTPYTWPAGFKPKIGNTIAVTVSTWTGSAAAHTVDDDAGNTYVPITTSLEVSGAHRTTLFAATVNAIPNTTTIRHSAAGGNACTFSEFSGLTGFDVGASINTNLVGATSFPVGPTAALAGIGELVFSVFGLNSADNAVGIVEPPGYTALGLFQDVADYMGHGAAYTLAGTAAAQSAAWSIAKTGSADRGTRCIAAFKTTPVSAYDTQWSRVQSVLNFNGANGSTSIVDGTGRAWNTVGSNAKQETSGAIAGTASGRITNVDSYFRTTGTGSAPALGAGDFLIELMFQLEGTSLTDGATLLDANADNAGGYSLLIVSNKTMYFYGANNPFGSEISLTTFGLNPLDGGVHEIKVQRESGTTSIYFDGIRVAQGTDSTNYTPQAGSYATLGRRQTAGTRPMVGRVDALRITTASRYAGSPAYIPTPIGDFPTSGAAADVTTGGVWSASQSDTTAFAGTAVSSGFLIANQAGASAFAGAGVLSGALGATQTAGGAFTGSALQGAAATFTQQDGAAFTGSALSDGANGSFYASQGDSTTFVGARIVARAITIAQDSGFDARVAAIRGGVATLEQQDGALFTAEQIAVIVSGAFSMPCAADFMAVRAGDDAYLREPLVIDDDTITRPSDDDAHERSAEEFGMTRHL